MRLRLGNDQEFGGIERLMLQAVTKLFEIWMGSPFDRVRGAARYDELARRIDDTLACTNTTFLSALDSPEHSRYIRCKVQEA